MIKKIKQLITSLSLSVSLLAPVAIAGTAAAQPNIQENLNQGTCLSTTSGDCEVADADTTINNIIETVINIFSLVVGVVSVIMIIIGGFKYITSGGESNNITSAKNTILYAIIGLVIVALAQFIVRFVLGRVIFEN